VRPVSEGWGYDRGTPVDRWYIERFLAEHRDDIHGRVLEVKDSAYTDRFGRNVSERGVLDIDPGNSKATYVADLTSCPEIATSTFDCFILTQTLQFVYDVGAAIEQTHRILRPGGVVLVTMPVASRLAPPPLTDFWRFTPLVAGRLFEERFGAAGVTVRGVGNVLTQVAFLEGLAVDDLTTADLETDELYFPLLVCLRAQKSG
jgi:SAM-dependent methyltransferase